MTNASRRISTLLAVLAALLIVPLAVKGGPQPASTENQKIAARTVAADSITTKGLSVVDDQGRSRIELGIGDTGSWIVFRDENGTPACVLGLSPKPGPGPNDMVGPVLIMTSSTGQPRYVIGSKANGDIALTVADGSGSNRIVISSLSNGSAGLSVLDKNGTAVAAVGVDAYGKGFTLP